MTNDEIQVVTWVPWEITQGPEGAKMQLDLMGGFFQDGMGWSDYLRKMDPEDWPYLEAIRRDVIRLNKRINGAQHQNLDDGVPMFNNGAVACFSFRGWGDLMAAIWSEEEGKDYNYMDFYC